ncbi:hypothetical protein SRB5_26650 [Streptomyces sp. RB5]|uniref:D-alanyl-D-alanine carboxypeptidase n=1 Tax=Streptomyces smaragdinus TaxID=2585196 RepID=A0A7K0CGC0_9ACTN|nr:hypothetical protein [Streptomyces smaragdinus]MQY12530.1 hypothetical protein [Streptomyces smaragdinus]
MSVTFTAQDKSVIRTAAYGAVSLLAAADAAGSPHKIATQGSIALASSTGTIGHLLAEKSKIGDLGGKSVAELADKVLPALTEAMALIKKQDPAEADSFRAVLHIALESGVQARKGGVSPAMTEMIRKIDEALDAA